VRSCFCAKKSLIPVIEALQHANVYHVGTPTITEVDIILPQECPLVLAHNIGESVQMALESLSGCARAYVVRLRSCHEASSTRGVQHVDVTANPATGHKSAH
jgi:hypothetical protein